MQRNWEEISAELAACLASSQEHLIDIANNSGANYHSVRRYKIFGIKSRTENALKLCSYFSIITTKNVKKDLGFEDIMSVAKSTWDGTAAHAEFLVSLIESTKSFKLKKR
ncbi:MAG: hypothetical protein LBK03_02165 [Bacteroidales bacterium]|nr:hypothetical protein [Bacteroidales bacterium]